MEQEIDTAELGEAIVKKLKSIAKVVEVNSLNKKELPKIVRQMFAQRKAEITDSALEELLSRLNNDMYENFLFYIGYFPMLNQNHIFFHLK